MTENLTFNLDEVYREILRRRRERGACSHDNFLNLIDQVLDEKRTSGELTDDFDFKGAREKLEYKWQNIEKRKSE